jgi:hypothetical protein
MDETAIPGQETSRIYDSTDTLIVADYLQYLSNTNMSFMPKSSDSADGGVKLSSESEESRGVLRSLIGSSS